MTTSWWIKIVSPKMFDFLYFEMFLKYEIKSYSIHPDHHKFWSKFGLVHLVALTPLWIWLCETTLWSYSSGYHLVRPLLWWDQPEHLIRSNLSTILILNPKTTYCRNTAFVACTFPHKVQYGMSWKAEKQDVAFCHFKAGLL